MIDRQHRLRDFTVEEIGPNAYVAVCKFCGVRGPFRNDGVEAAKVCRVQFPDCPIGVALSVRAELVYVAVTNEAIHSYLSSLVFYHDEQTGLPYYEFKVQAVRGAVIRLFTRQTAVDVLRRWGMYTRRDDPIPRAVTDHVTNRAYVDPELLKGESESE